MQRARILDGLGRPVADLQQIGLVDHLQPDDVLGVRRIAHLPQAGGDHGIALRPIRWGIDVRHHADDQVDLRAGAVAAPDGGELGDHPRADIGLVHADPIAHVGDAEILHGGDEVLGRVGLVGVALEVDVQLHADRVAEQARRRRVELGRGDGRGAGGEADQGRQDDARDRPPAERRAQGLGHGGRLLSRRGWDIRSVMNTTCPGVAPPFGVPEIQ